MRLDEGIARIAEAIAYYEGFYKAGSVAKRHRNPGNLRTWGTLPVERGYVVFPSDDAGWEALRIQIRKNLKRGLTFLEFFGGKPGVYSGYAPAADSNEPDKYARFVARRVGIAPDVVIADALEAA